MCHPHSQVDFTHTLNQQDADAQVTEDLDRVPLGTSMGHLQGCSGGAKAVATSTPSRRASASSAAAAVHHSPITHAPSPQHPPSGLLSAERLPPSARQIYQMTFIRAAEVPPTAVIRVSDVKGRRPHPAAARRARLPEVRMSIHRRHRQPPRDLNRVLY